jgi:hypothetical protein
MMTVRHLDRLCGKLENLSAPNNSPKDSSGRNAELYGIFGFKMHLY